MKSGRHVQLGFFLFGVLNNLIYVVMLSAASDIVSSPSSSASSSSTGLVSLVLLAADVPALCAQTLSPFFLSKLAYSVKVPVVVLLSIAAYHVVASADSVVVKLCGVMVSSVCFGLGESTFLPLASKFSAQPGVLAAYGAGTGGAGLAGSGVYLLLTSVMDLEPPRALQLLSVVPPVMLYAYFVLVQPALVELDTELHELGGRQDSMESDDTPLTSGEKLAYLHRLARYFIPLFLIYVLTFSINHALVPYLHFAESASEDSAHSPYYVVFFFCYQTGVFISRSSLSVVKLPSLILPSLVQFGNFLVIYLHITDGLTIPSPHVAAGLLFTAGLLSGATYVNTFHRISQDTSKKYREFSMGIVSTATTSGPIVAGLFGIWLENALAGYLGKA